MPAYENTGGQSGIASYEAGPTYIRITFRDGWSYLYTYLSTGQQHVEAMKAHAVEGRGLNTYISKHVGGNYATRRHASETPRWQYSSHLIETHGMLSVGVIDPTALDARFNELGSEGWELVSVSPISAAEGGTSRLLVNFKRQI